MYEVSRKFKRKVVIHNEIMIHFGFPKPTTNNQRPYKDEKWRALKMQHKMDKMFLLILDMELFKKLYSKKMKLNPSNKVPPSGFKYTLLKWVQSAIPHALIAEEILFDTHYKFDRVGSMAKLKEVIEMHNLVSFL
jgi:hypothetical protein